MYRTRNIKVSEHISLRVKDTDYASFRVADVLGDVILENRAFLNGIDYDSVFVPKSEADEYGKRMNLGRI